MKSFIRQIKIKLRNKIKVSPNNTVKISSSARVRQCNIFIKGNKNQLIIENGCNLRGLNIEIIGNGCTLLIGECTTNTGHGKISCREQDTQLEIGAHSLLAAGVTILTSDGHEIYGDSGQRINQAKDIIIGKHVWLGQDAMILKGANIGDDVIIGARAVVTHTIAKNCIAAGQPARVIKENINWDEQLREVV